MAISQNEKNMRLIRLVDWQPIIAAILLFQYDRLVSAITSGLRQTDLRGKKVLITSCAFGNVIPRVVQASMDAGASRVLVADIILNELQHARSKLPAFAGRVDYIEENATAMTLADGSVDANVIFFLLHELPHELKGEALRETRLKDALKPVSAQYDFILIDCPPSLSLLTLNGFCAAHGVIIPMQCEYFALEGLSDLVNTIKKVHANFNTDLQIIGLLRVMFDPRRDALLERLRALDPDALSPREAHALLCELHGAAREIY